MQLQDRGLDMTDEQLDRLIQRASAGDDDAQAEIDAWIEEALGPLCVTPPLDGEAQGPDADWQECCGACTAMFA